MKNKLALAIGALTIGAVAIAVPLAIAAKEKSKEDSALKAEKRVKPIPFKQGLKIPQTLAFETKDENKHQLSDIKEPLVLLHFWASWCGPCVQKFPKMLDDLKEHKGDVAVIAMSLDHDPKAMNLYIDSLDTKGVKIYWGIDYDFKMSYQTYRITGTPETVFLDKQRSVIDKVNGGYKWGTKKAQDNLRSFIGKSG